MPEVRSWTVRSNSFRPDYAILGETLAQAIERNFQRIAFDAHIGAPGSYRLLGLAAEYLPGILSHRGGVEVTVDYERASTGESKRAVVWVYARRDDLPKRVELPVQRVATAA